MALPFAPPAALDAKQLVQEALGLDALRAEADQKTPPLSTELDSRDEPMLAVSPEDPKVQHALAALYGDTFPLLKKDPQESDWMAWAEELWKKHSAGVQSRLHLVARNRLFRKGVQWVSAVGLGPWREPPKPRDAARVVRNLVAPALDQRTQVVTEQRPGFRAQPATQDPDDLKKAEAQQAFLEYQYEQQGMEHVVRELSYWAGTDGASFGEVYWDAHAGPWHEAFGQGPTGEEVPLGPDGQPSPEAHKFPLGDPKTRVRRIEQIRVSADASATHAPWYWVVRDVLPKSQAVRDYGPDVAEAENTGGEAQVNQRISQATAARLGFLLPDDDELLKEQDTVDRITVYCDRSEFLPQGLQLVIVGRKVVFGPGPLVMGMVPLFRFTDGSTDPSFYPTPIMDGWIDAQMRVNAVLSKWVENVRLNSGARLLAKENTITSETYTAGAMTVIGVKGMGGVNDSVRPLEAFDISQGAKELLALEQKAFEDLSGWNDTSRGSFSADQSGRAILAIREQLERVFAPPVNSAARAMTEWGKITLGWGKWGYDLPRTLGTLGHSRPDLARSISADDFDGVVDVFIDPETLMPMPRALRLFLLKDMFAQGLMTPQEYRRRMPFAYTRSLATPDEDQEARARRVVEAIRRTGNPLALEIKWQDNEAIHQDILERELILPDDVPPPVAAAAQQRWMMLAQQAMMKMGGMPPQGPQPGGPQQGGPGGPRKQQGGGLSPQEQPFQGTNPSVAASTGSHIGGTTDQGAAAQEFDHRSTQ